MESLKDAKLKDAQIRLWGKIVNVSEVEPVGENDTPLQKIIVYVKPVRNADDEVVGREQFWRLDLMGNKVVNYHLDFSDEGKRVCVIAWLDSQRVPSKTEGNPDMFIINAKVHLLEFLS